MQKLRNTQHGIWTRVNSTLNWRSTSSSAKYSFELVQTKKELIYKTNNIIVVIFVSKAKLHDELFHGGLSHGDTASSD
jgi:hypothetical protein